MKRTYDTYGTLAIEPYFEEPAGDVIALDWYLGNDTVEKSEVEKTLDDFDGKPLAKTRSERKFAAIALAVAGFATFFFSFAPIF